MKADVKFTPGKKSLKALVSASRDLDRSQFPQVPGGLMCMKEETIKRKHGSRRQG